MKYIVISTVNNWVNDGVGNQFIVPESTVVAELKNDKLAQKLMQHYNETSRNQVCRIHKVMDDYEVEQMLTKLYPKQMTAKERLNKFIDWLEETGFGNDLINDLSHEIATSMSSMYVRGCEYWDYKREEAVKFEVDKDEPNVLELFEFVLNNLKEDRDLLFEYGVARGKKTSKKRPYLYTDIDWSVFYNKEFL